MSEPHRPAWAEDREWEAWKKRQHKLHPASRRALEQPPLGLDLLKPEEGASAFQQDLQALERELMAARAAMQSVSCLHSAQGHSTVIYCTSWW